MASDYCDLEDILYSLDSAIWSESAKDLLLILEFPVDNSKKVETWLLDEFLYYDLTLLNNISYKDKMELENIINISKIYLSEYINVNCFAIELNTNYKSRTELAVKITKILSKVLNCYNIFILKNDNAIAFTGAFFNEGDSNLELFISEWFEYNMSQQKYIKLHEIRYMGNYYDYLYSIARPYQRYKESEIYLKYGCGHIEKTFGYIDIRDVYKENKNYFREIYGYDYYEDFIIKNYEEKEDDDLEWTLLELELESMNFDIKEEDQEYSDDYECDYYEDEYDGDIFVEMDNPDNVNPEKMLKIIKKKRAQSHK